MRPVLRLLTLGLVLLGAALSRAQTLPDAPGLSLREAGASLLAWANVRAELGVTAPESAKLDRILADGSQRRLSSASAGAGAEALAKIERESAAMLLGALAPTQRARLFEITVQLRGASALLDPEVGKLVGLTPSQRSRFGAIFAAADQREEKLEAEVARKLEALPEPSTPELRRRLPALRRATYDEAKPQREALARKRKADEAKVLAALTPSQRKRWEALVGAKFDPKRPSR